MKKAILLTLAICVFAITTGSAARAEANKLIQIVIDNSATLQNPEEAVKFQAAWMLLFAKELRGSAGRDAQVHIVTTQNPRTVWEGPAPTLQNSFGLLVQSEIQHVADGCNELGTALDRVKQHISRTPTDDVEIYVFSSLIPTGAPCKDARIVLPQPVPQTIDLRSLVRPELSRLEFMWAEEGQAAVWADYFERSGLVETMNAQGVAFSLRGETTTRQKIIEAVQQ